jgi:hydrogenase maturation protein HypF
LHHILMRQLGIPVVATSGNVSDEPICTDNCEALNALGGIADLFLMHNRPIARHVDDSVVQLINDKPMVLRSARGYAPLTLSTDSANGCTLAVGGHLKNSVAVSVGSSMLLSQHIGDLETLKATNAMSQTVRSLLELHQTEISQVVRDLHPDYASSRFAEQSLPPTHSVQHHYAHVWSCMLDNDIEAPALGVSWDGTGLGPDNTVWGGEFLKIDPDGFERLAHLRHFRLPGGERAVLEPYRSAVSLLYDTFEDDPDRVMDLAPLAHISRQHLNALISMLRCSINSPVTSSAGRLFDAVASLTGIRHVNSFEGQAAMELQFAAERASCSANYDFPIETRSRPNIIDWRQAVREIAVDLTQGVSPEIIAAKFHNGLAKVITRVAELAGEEKVVLTGGCFQNRYLLEHTINLLDQAGFRPYRHHLVPPNDGGLAIGQLAAAMRSPREDC